MEEIIGQLLTPTAIKPYPITKNEIESRDNDRSYILGLKKTSVKQMYKLRNNLRIHNNKVRR